MKAVKITYWLVTIALSGLMLFAAFNYVFRHDLIVNVFEKLGYPTYIIYPLASAKVLGLVAIWTRISTSLKEWAYAGFFFNFLLAFSAHINIGDGQFVPAVVCMILLTISYVLDKNLNPAG